MLNRFPTCACSCLTLGVAVGAAFAQNTILVPGDFPTIQQAIDAAESGDEVVVSPGVHEGPIDLLGKAIHLRSSDGPQSTTIDAGGVEASVVTMVSGEGPQTIIEGFTITGGEGTLVDDERYGGGMYLSGTSPTIIDCTFEENVAERGGGLAAVNQSEPQLIGCVFQGNSVLISFPTPDALGGAIYNRDSTLALTNCSFINNLADGGAKPSLGGAIYSRDGVLTGNNCFFDINRASTTGSPFGGALYIENSEADLTACVFFNNRAAHAARDDGRGGAIYNNGSDVVLTGCVFESNRAVGDEGFARGGAIFNLNSDPMIVECDFISNRSISFDEHPSAHGGAIYNWASSPVIIDCNFTGNMASAISDQGGSTQATGGAIDGTPTSAPTIIGTTFTDNSASSSGGSPVTSPRPKANRPGAWRSGTAMSGSGSAAASSARFIRSKRSPASQSSAARCRRY